MDFFNKSDMENLMLRFTNILLEISIFIVIIGTLYSLTLYVSDIVFWTTLSHKFGLHQILTLMIFVEIFAMVSIFILIVAISIYKYCIFRSIFSKPE